MTSLCRFLLQFAIVDAAYPFVAAQLLRDDSPRLRAALRYMVRGQVTGTCCLY